MTPSARFCYVCGAPLEERFVDADRRTRQVCSACGTVSYRNPQVLVSAVVVAAGRVLLCRRAQAPAVGRWTLPGGFLECEESLEQAAARETLEETGLVAEPSAMHLLALSTLPDLNEVHVGFRTELVDEPRLVCGPECSEVRFFDEAGVPWSELAYAEIGNYLRVFFEERRERRHAIHLSCLSPAGVVGHCYRIAEAQPVHIVRSSGWNRWGPAAEES